MQPVFRTRLLAGAAATVAALGLSLNLAPAASAHDHLVGSSPTAGATLDSAPPRLELRFDHAVLARGAEIAISSPGGSTVTRRPTISGQTVSAPFGATANGEYHVTWRVTSADGHPVSGDLDFTVHTSGAPAATSAPATLTGPSTPTTNEPGDNEPALVIGVFTAAAVALVGAWFVARRRVRSDPS